MKLLAVCYILVCLLVFTQARIVKQPEKTCIGCAQQVESSHPDIRKYSIIAVNKYKQEGEIPGNARLIRVLDAKRRTVAGIIYEFVLEFVYKLPRNVGQYSALCKVEIYQKLGNQPADITTHPCKKTRASVPDIKTF